MPPTKCENDLLFGGREDNSSVTLWGSRRQVSMSVLCFFPWRISCGSQRSLRPFPVPPFLQFCHTQSCWGLQGHEVSPHFANGTGSGEGKIYLPLVSAHFVLCVFIKKLYVRLRQEADGPPPPRAKLLEIHSQLTEMPRGGWALPAQTTCLPDLPNHTCTEKAPWRPKGSHVKGGSTQTPFW